MRVDDNGSSRPNYWPNTFEGPDPDSSRPTPPIDVAGTAWRHDVQLEDEDFVQAGDLYSRVMDDTARQNLIDNIVGHLEKAVKRIQLRQTALFWKADEDYGRRVAKGLGLNADKVRELASMSQEERVRATSK